jgi:preprotein translocase subunit SecE
MKPKRKTQGAGIRFMRDSQGLIKPKTTWHWKVNHFITVLLVLAVIVGGSVIFWLVNKVHKYETTAPANLDPVRVRVLWLRVAEVAPPKRVDKERATRVARTIALLPERFQPVYTAILERENSYTNTRGAAGEYECAQIMPGNIRWAAVLTGLSEDEIKNTPEGSIRGGFAIYLWNYTIYGDFAKAATAYNGRRKGDPFPSEYGVDITRRSKVLQRWIDSVYTIELSKLRKR